MAHPILIVWCPAHVLNQKPTWPSHLIELGSVTGDLASWLVSTRIRSVGAPTAVLGVLLLQHALQENFQDINLIVRLIRQSIRVCIFGKQQVIEDETWMNLKRDPSLADYSFLNGSCASSPPSDVAAAVVCAVDGVVDSRQGLLRVLFFPQ